MDVFRRNAMDAAFRLSEAREGVERALSNARRELDFLEQRSNLAVVPMAPLVGREDIDVEGADSLALDALDRDLDVAEPKPCGNRAQCVDIGARVEERGEEHVAGQSADAI
jgi:hypothetical protein